MIDCAACLLNYKDASIQYQPFLFYSLNPYIMCSFTLPFTGSAKSLVARAKKAVESAGGTFKGNTSKGSIEIKKPATVAGNYTISGQNLNVTITKKPFFISCSIIQSELSKLLGASNTVPLAAAADFATSRTVHTDDILPHISAPHHLAARASSSHGCVTLLGMIQVCYTLSNDEVKISVELKTPLGSVSLGSATLNVNNPSVTLGGGIAGFKAEVTISINFQTLELKLCGKLCAPFAGCTSGCTSIHL